MHLVRNLLLNLGYSDTNPSIWKLVYALQKNGKLVDVTIHYCSYQFIGSLISKEFLQISKEKKIVATTLT